MEQLKVLAKCEEKVEICCPGYLEAKGVKGGKRGLKCVKESGCGGRSQLTNPSGVISTLNYPELYQSNSNCFWRIEAPLGQRVQLDFSRIETEDSAGCKFDSILIKDSKTEKVFCGTRPPLALLSAGQFLEIQFDSDEQLNFRGFTANYTFVDDNRKQFHSTRDELLRYSTPLLPFTFRLKLE